MKTLFAFLVSLACLVALSVSACQGCSMSGASIDDNVQVIYDTITAEVIVSNDDCIEYIKALEAYVSVLEEAIDGLNDTMDSLFMHDVIDADDIPGEYRMDVIVEGDTWLDYKLAQKSFDEKVYGAPLEDWEE